jgi:hypothetical protein
MVGVGDREFTGRETSSAHALGARAVCQLGSRPVLSFLGSECAAGWMR